MGYRLSSLPNVGRQAASLARVVREARRVHGARPLARVRRARLLRRRQGYEHEEALRDGLLDPAIGAEDLRGFVRDHENTAVQRRLNGEDSPALVSDKGVLYLYCRALGLRASELLGIVHRVGDAWVRPQVIVRDRDQWERADATSTPVSEVMTSKVTTVGPGDDLTDAADAMRGAAVRRLVVVDDGLVVGVLSHGALVQATDGEGAGRQATLGVTAGA